MKAMIRPRPSHRRREATGLLSTLCFGSMIFSRSIAVEMSSFTEEVRSAGFQVFGITFGIIFRNDSAISKNFGQENSMSYHIVNA